MKQALPVLMTNELVSHQTAFKIRTDCGHMIHINAIQQLKMHYKQCIVMEEMEHIIFE